MSRRPLRSDTARAIANLAIELGDPGRMAKARRLHRGNAVSDVDIRPGSASAAVTTADGELVEIELLVAPGTLDDTPTAADLSFTCADHGQPEPACVEVLTGILGLAEAVEENGRLLDVWLSAPEEQHADNAPRGENQGFFGGPWQRVPLPKLSRRADSDAPSLVVDAVDAGPVLADATATIQSGLSRFRAPR